MFSTNEIKELIKVLENSQLSVLELKDAKCSIRLEKPQAVAVAPQVVTSVPVAETPSVVTSQPVATEVVAVTPASDESRTINSPMVGVFYSSPSPDSDPFVSVGKTVKKGDVVCIVEAMKIMNEITAEESGTITEILVKNGDVVEYGQPMFKIN